MLVHDKLLELLNIDNPNTVIFDNNNISFSDPIAEVGNGYDTKILASALPGTLYTGSILLYYTRINLLELGNAVWLFSDVPFTTDIVISILNTARNAFLIVDDLETIIIPGMALGDIRSIVFTAKPNSVNWIGSNVASIIIGFPSIVNRLNTLLNTKMPTVGYLA
jgi:hypothetical protein